MHGCYDSGMQRLNARWLALLGITLISLYLCWLIIAPFLDVLIWAIVLAIVSHPIHRKLRERGWNETWAALATVTAVIFIALIPIGLVTASVIAQIPDAIEQVKQAVVKGKELLYSDTRVGHLLQRLVGQELLNDPAQLGERIKEWIALYTQQTIGVVGGLFTAVLKICFALFTLFYLLRDEAVISKAVINALPLDSKQSMAVYKRCRDVIKASVNGTMVIAAIQGTLGALAFWVLGIPSALLWGFVMFVMAMIPAIGAPAVWLPAVVFLLATGAWGKAIGLALWGGLIIGSLDNLLRPRLVGQRAGFHDLIIFFSVIGGLQVFGILGLFVGPVVVAIALAIVEVFKQMNPVAIPVTDRPASEAGGSTPDPNPPSASPSAAATSDGSE